MDALESCEGSLAQGFMFHFQFMRNGTVQNFAANATEAQLNGTLFDDNGSPNQSGQVLRQLSLYSGRYVAKHVHIYTVRELQPSRLGVFHSGWDLLSRCTGAADARHLLHKYLCYGGCGQCLLLLVQPVHKELLVNERAGARSRTILARRVVI
jgi:hypothetical protein